PPVPGSASPPYPSPAHGFPTPAPATHPGVPPADSTPAPAKTSAPKSLKELEREGIIAALQATGGNKAQAAQILEIDRSTLYKKIKDYGIDT
ncbi:MAG: sigma-54-dependent Fis family transcriptional regulator, partial [Deltaproteobacteria bacterium]|nr:sigma-54-dependent Fis family transcriptional regulator [Deltaproteobacteria bacterium]